MTTTTITTARHSIGAALRRWWRAYLDWVGYYTDAPNPLYRGNKD